MRNVPSSTIFQFVLVCKVITETLSFPANLTQVCQIFDKVKLFLNPFLVAPKETHPCSPSPCGPNSQCREINEQAVCSCVVGFLGSPPNCRPECVVSSECPLNEACVNQKCIDPCPGTCGVAAICNVVNHNPICSCPSQYSGDPFTRCTFIRKQNTKRVKIYRITRTAFFLQKALRKLEKILANPHLVVQTRNAKCRATLHHVRACPNLLELHQTANPNALVTANVLVTWPA